MIVLLLAVICKIVKVQHGVTITLDGISCTVNLTI